MTKKPKQPRKAAVDRVAQEVIGYQLRAMYSEIIRQPLPEALVATLRAIEEAEGALSRQPERLRRAA